jgi:hypothetical protein
MFEFYGRTQIDCYNKLKMVCDKIEIEQAQKFLAKVDTIITHIHIKTMV